MNKKIRIALLAAMSVILIYGGWMPMDFRMPSDYSEASNALKFWQITPHQLLTSGDIQLNILLFVPVGLLVGWCMGINILSLAAAVALAAAISCTIEIGQLFLPLRYCTLRDVITNTSGAGVGWMLGIFFFWTPLRTRWRRAANILGHKYGLLAAVAIAAAILAKSAICVKLSGAVLKQNLLSILAGPMGDPARFSGLKWLTLGILPYMAITLLLSSRRRDRQLGDGRIFASGLCSLLVLGGSEAMYLLNPAETTGLAALLLGWLGVAIAIPLAPLLHRRRIELPELVLAGEICLALLLIRVAWSASGGGTALPLWGLYQHEYSWGYFAMARRLAFMAMIGFFAAFYLSLKFPWSMRVKASVAAASAVVAAMTIELAKFLSGHAINIAGLLEHSTAAIFGTMLFAMTWGYLDRRSISGRKTDPNIPNAYRGPERRN